MLILGLGSNCGQRYQHLRAAIAHLKQHPNIRVIKTSAIYESHALLPENAPSHWQKDYLNMALYCETDLTPNNLLTEIKQIEKTMGREYYARWSPRIIDIDILAWGDINIQQDKLTIPHNGLEQRPFALWPLLDLTPDWVHPVWQKKAKEMAKPWGSRFSGKAPLNTQQVNADILETQIMGALNITHDSFSDGGLYLDPDKAYQQAVKIIEAGADILDIGAESTNFIQSKTLDVDQEWQRLQPIITRIKQDFPKTKISIDTRNPKTAKKVLDLGIDILNDVSGFENATMCALAKAYDVNIVMMHHLGIPSDRSINIPFDQDPVKTVLDWGESRIKTLNEMGIAPSKITFDVGIGFGKVAEQSMALIKHIDQFHTLGVKLCVGHSRKSFLTLVTDQPYHERDLETAVVSNYLAKQNVHLIRVHNVQASKRAVKLSEFV